MLSILITTPTSGPTRVDINDDKLQGEGVSIGRLPRCAVQVDDPSVSRSHARFLMRDGTVLIEDVGSSAGTSLNGVRLVPRQPTRLSGTDKLTIGPCSLSIVAPAVEEGENCPTMMAEPPVTSYLPLAGIDPAGMPRWSGGELPVRVVRVVDETHDVKTFVFAAETPTLFHYLPGQFMMLHLRIDGTSVQRSYTISSSPSRPHLLSVTVKRVAGADGQLPGLVSNFLHDKLQAGDRITISGPYGDFTCAKHPAPRLLLVSGGSGITPMLSMARWLTDTHATADTVFLHGARSSRDLVARNELELLANHNPYLRLLMITSRPEPGSAWLGISGRICLELLVQAVPDYAARRIFCCGPAPFMDGIKKMLGKAGFPMEGYHEESFGGPPAKKPAATAQHASVLTPPGGNPAAAAVPTPAYGLEAILRGISSEKRERQEDKTPVRGQPASGGQRTAVAAPPATAGAVLTCSKSKKTVSCAPGTAILEALEGAGLNWPSGCRMGKCGVCKAKVTGGVLDRAGYDDAILSAADRSAGFVLTCVGKPAGALTLEA